MNCFCFFVLIVTIWLSKWWRDDLFQIFLKKSPQRNAVYENWSYHFGRSTRSIIILSFIIQNNCKMQMLTFQKKKKQKNKNSIKMKRKRIYFIDDYLYWWSWLIEMKGTSPPLLMVNLTNLGCWMKIENMIKCTKSKI